MVVMIFMKQTQEESKSVKLHRSRTPEGREDQLIALAMDRAEERLLNGTATSQEIVHFLKLGSTKERLEKEKLEADVKLAEAKIESIKSMERIEELYLNAMNAMREYQGGDVGNDERA